MRSIIVTTVKNNETFIYTFEVDSWMTSCTVQRIDVDTETFASIFNTIEIHSSTSIPTDVKIGQNFTFEVLAGYNNDRPHVVLAGSVVSVDQKEL
jgi:hypothetical protein